MVKQAYIHARISEQTKRKAESIFNKVGITTSEAIRLFLSQVVLQKAIPFSINIPNEDTVLAMEEVEKKKTKKIDNLSDLLND